MKQQTHSAAMVLTDYAHLEAGQSADDTVRVCGRIMRERFSWRFIDLQDESGTIQLVCQQPEMIRFLNRGDIIAVVGKPMRTKSGPPSIKIESWKLLAKCTRELPDDPAFLADPEVRYRQRDVDLILNDRSREILRKRSLATRAMRSFLDEQGFLEFETPILQVQAGGAEAKPFATHHNALNLDMHLRIAPEFYLRRLIVGGFEKVYEIGKNFRNEGISTRHSPEFTSIELFQAYGDYVQLMGLTENLLRHVADTVCGDSRVHYQGLDLSFDRPVTRLCMTDAIKLTCGVDVDKIESCEAMRSAAMRLGVRLTHEQSRGEIINAIFEDKVQHTLLQPTFITDYPVEVSVCQQLHQTKPGFVERFELFVFGRELANGCSELNDPREQRRRFEMQASRKASGQQDLPDADLEFIAAMEYGMPPMMGLGIGIDRLIMLLVNASSIRDVISFPTVKPQKRARQEFLKLG